MTSLQRPVADTAPGEAFHSPSRAALVAATAFTAAAATGAVVAAPRAGAWALPVLLAGFGAIVAATSWLLRRYRADPVAEHRPGVTFVVAGVGYWAVAALALMTG